MVKTLQDHCSLRTYGRGGAGKIAYIVEKSAFDGLAMGFSSEFSGKGLSFSVLHPGIVETENIVKRIDKDIIDKFKAASDNNQLIQLSEVVCRCMPFLTPNKGVAGQITELTGGVQW